MKPKLLKAMNLYLLSKDTTHKKTLNEEELKAKCANWERAIAYGLSLILNGMRIEELYERLP